MCDTRSEYFRGLGFGFIALALDAHDAQRGDCTVLFEPNEFQEGYRDALDDSDDMPDPFDP